MKKLNAILATLVASVSIASAQDSGSELSVSATFAWESEYVFRGAGLAEDTFMPSVDISYGSFYAGLWAALPVDSSAYTNEVDLYAGYGFGISEVLSADVGVTYYTYPDLQDDFFDSDVNTLEFYAGLALEAIGSPSAYVYYDIDLEQLTFEVSGGHSIAIDDNSAVDISAFVGYADRDLTTLMAELDWVYWGAGVAYSYSFTDNASVSVGVNYYAADEDMMTDGGDDEFSYGFSFTAGF